MLFADASRHQVLPDGLGYHCSLTLRVANVITGRRPRNGNPTCQRGSYSTRTIVFDSVRNSREGRVSNAHTRKFKALEPGSNGVMVGFLFTMERVLKCLPDGLGYHVRQDLSVPSAGFVARLDRSRGFSLFYGVCTHGIS